MQLVKAAHGVTIKDGWPKALKQGEKGSTLSSLSWRCKQRNKRAELTYSAKAFINFMDSISVVLFLLLDSIATVQARPMPVLRGRREIELFRSTNNESNLSEIDIEVPNVEWARTIEGMFPDALMPDAEYNLLRCLVPNAAGINAPMALLVARCTFLTSISREQAYAHRTVE